MWTLSLVLMTCVPVERPACGHPAPSTPFALLHESPPVVPPFAARGKLGSTPTPIASVFAIDHGQPADGSIADRALTLPWGQVQEPRGSWRRIAFGAGLGLAAGFLVGWSIDRNQSQPAVVGGDAQSDYDYRVSGALVGAGVGALVGWVTGD